MVKPTVVAVEATSFSPLLKGTDFGIFTEVTSRDQTTGAVLLTIVSGHFLLVTVQCLLCRGV